MSYVGDALISAYNSAGSRSAGDDIYGGNSYFWTNVFNPQGSEQIYNAYQAQLERDFNARQAQITRDFNASEAQKSRDFEERMSGTAYQRAVSDMRNAGINPYLVYGGASSASTPSGTSASSGSAYSSSARSGSGRPSAIEHFFQSGFSALASVASLIV